MSRIQDPYTHVIIDTQQPKAGGDVTITWTAPNGGRAQVVLTEAMHFAYLNTLHCQARPESPKPTLRERLGRSFHK